MRAVQFANVPRERLGEGDAMNQLLSGILDEKSASGIIVDRPPQGATRRPRPVMEPGTCDGQDKNQLARLPRGVDADRSRRLGLREPEPNETGEARPSLGVDRPH
jgi:hypothetical protein